MVENTNFFRMKEAPVLRDTALDAFTGSGEIAAIGVSLAIIGLEQKVADVGARQVDVRSKLLEDTRTRDVLSANLFISNLHFADDGQGTQAGKREQRNEASKADPKQDAGLRTCGTCVQASRYTRATG
jgi:hypothetical protein